MYKEWKLGAAEAQNGKLRDVLVELVRAISTTTFGGGDIETRTAVTALQNATLALVMDCARCGKAPSVQTVQDGSAYRIYCNTADCAGHLGVTDITLIGAVEGWNHGCVG